MARLGGTVATSVRLEESQQLIKKAREAQKTIKQQRQIKVDESPGGRFNAVAYQDNSKEKIWTIGYGFNLQRKNSQALLDLAGVKKSVKLLQSKVQTLTESEAEALFQQDYKAARVDAEKFVGKSTWNKLNKDRQGVLINMSFNLGATKLNKFDKFRKGLVSGSIEDSTKEMINSKWFRQVGDRSKRLVKLMRDGFDPTDKPINSVGDIASNTEPDSGGFNPENQLSSRSVMGEADITFGDF